MIWQQNYDPLGNMVLSTLLAALPVVVMLVCLGFLHIKAHIAAGLGLITALLVAIFAYGMPADMAGRAATSLLFSYRIGDPAPWMRDPDARLAFPMAVRAVLLRNNNPLPFV